MEEQMQQEPYRVPCTFTTWVSTRRIPPLYNCCISAQNQTLTAGNGYVARSDHCMFWINGSNLVLFGGSNFNVFDNDIWSFNRTGESCCEQTVVTRGTASPAFHQVAA